MFICILFQIMSVVSPCIYLKKYVWVFSFTSVRGTGIRTANKLHGSVDEGARVREYETKINNDGRVHCSSPYFLHEWITIWLNVSQPEERTPPRDAFTILLFSRRGELGEILMLHDLKCSESKSTDQNIPLWVKKFRFKMSTQI